MSYNSYKIKVGRYDTVIQTIILIKLLNMPQINVVNRGLVATLYLYLNNKKWFRKEFYKLDSYTNI